MRCLLTSLAQALVRPGRIDARIRVGLPGKEDRLCVLQEYSAGMALHDDVDLALLANDGATGGCTCAELATICREAGMRALRGSLDAVCATMEDFLEAARRVRGAQ